MPRRATLLAGLALLWPLAASAQHHGALTPAPETTGPIAPLLPNLGSYHHQVSTSNSRAQEFFDQGLRLVYAFNHAEAVRAFREAARLDPNLAMAHWGHAYALGPNVNDPITPERERDAHEAIQRAVALEANASPAERAYIDALAKRYSDRAGEDRLARDQAFVAAMKAVAAKYPDDPDASTIYAAGIMETMPWRYWRQDGAAQPGTQEVIDTLERTIARFPEHPGAHHFYIHIVEASKTPERGEKSADKLESLMPGAGHLIHMPAHIYLRVGRYKDAAESNVRAIKADEDYITQCKAQGIYPLSYYPHNIHFLWAASMWEGRSAVAIDAARQVADRVKAAGEIAPWAQPFLVAQYFAAVRFSRWDDLISQPAPDPKLPLIRGVWLYARGVALAERGRLDEASTSLADLRELLRTPEFEKMPMGNNTLRSVLAVGEPMLSGAIAERRGSLQEAIAHYDRGVRLEDALVYNEPADWAMPSRHVLGAALLKAGLPAEAETVYWEDLKRNPENGWALDGLARALDAQKKTDAASEARERFTRAWARADVKPTLRTPSEP
jgi:tetratricopeptide (TPR) repeat protein